jgi:hypothetical protein
MVCCLHGEYYDLIQETLSCEEKVFCLRQLMSCVECCTEEKVELMLGALLRQRSPLNALIALQRKVFNTVCFVTVDLFNFS